MGKPNETGLWMDSLADFRQGMNSDVPPVALQKNQLSFATNATLRGNYFTHRPPFKDLSLTFTGDIQTAFESGLFQGASYYKPDSGDGVLIASVGGRIFKIDVSGLVSEITPSSGSNPGFLQFAWMWQSENFFIINDGESIPIIFNGNSSVRATAGDVVGTLSTSAIIPAVGSSVSITLTGNYSGPYSSPVRVVSGASLIGSFEVTSESSG